MPSTTSPFRFFVTIMLLVVVAELAVMVALGVVYHHGEIAFRAEAWIDAAVLGVIVSPALYFYQYLPSQASMRKLAEINDELAFSSTLYQSTFQIAGAGIVHADMDGRFLRVNPQFCRITGYDERELLNLRFHDITHAEDLDADVNAVRRLGDGEINEFSMEKRYLRKGGETIWVHLTVTLVRDSERNPWFYIGVVDDITERKAREFEILKSQLEAEQANRTKDEFLAVVAHDLKSPLFSMTELLKIVHNEQKKTLSVKNNELLGHAIKTGEQMVVAIKKLLDLTRLQRGAVSLRMERASLKEIVGFALGKASFEAESKKVKLFNEVADDVRLKIDADLLVEIVYNLVSNAVKFSRKGDTVWVIFESGDCCLMVEDQGVGIPAEALVDIFDVKKKRISKGTAGEKGFGIGLPFCKKGMEMMGGSIWVDSEVDRGTRFFLKLPGLQKGETSPAAEEA